MTDLIILLAELLSLESVGISESTIKAVSPHDPCCICDECWYLFSRYHAAGYLQGIVIKPRLGGSWQGNHAFLHDILYWDGMTGQTKGTIQRKGIERARHYGARQL